MIRRVSAVAHQRRAHLRDKAQHIGQRTRREVEDAGDMGPRNDRA
jgi:hypothetical protein